MALWDIAANFSPALHQSSFQELRRSNLLPTAKIPDAAVDVIHTSTPLPSIFNYAQPPDYLASYAFAESFDKIGHESHQKMHTPSPIISINVLTKAMTVGRKDSFQFASLNTRGRIIIWMALTKSNSAAGSDLQQQNLLAGSTTDLGLRPGSTVRLIQLASILTEHDSSIRVRLLEQHV